MNLTPAGVPDKFAALGLTYDDLKAVAVLGTPVVVGIDTRELSDYHHAAGAHTVVVAGARNASCDAISSATSGAIFSGRL